MFSNPTGGGPLDLDETSPWQVHGLFQSEAEDDTIGWAIDSDGSDTGVWFGGLIAFNFSGTSTVSGATTGPLTSGVAVTINQTFTITADSSSVVIWTAFGPDGSTTMDWSASVSFGFYIVQFKIGPGPAPPPTPGGAHVGLVAEGDVPGGGDT